MGLTLSRRNDWEKYFAPPVATRCSKPESVANEIAMKQQARMEQAHFLPVSGVVSSCVIIDIHGDIVFNSGGSFESTSGKISYDAMQMIATAWKDTINPVPNGSTELGYRLYGLRIRDRLRIMALDALHYANTSGVSVSNIIPELWYNRPFEVSSWCDPYDMIIPQQNRNDITFDGLCEFLGYPISGTHEHEPAAQAEIARQLTLRSNLVSVEK